MNPVPPRRWTGMSPTPPGWWTTWRVARLTAVGHGKVGRALDAVERAERISDTFDNLTVGRSSARPRPPHKRSPRLVFVAVALTVLNAAAVVLMLAPPDEAATAADHDQIGTAILVGLLLAAGELTLAATLGRKLQADRLTAPPTLQAHRIPPEPDIPFEAAALCLLCGLVAWLIYLWTQTRIADTHPKLAVVLGICLAVQAWTAPWLLVADVAGARATQYRERAVVDRRLEQLAHEWESERLMASLALLSARSALYRAERSVARAVELDHKMPRASWSHHLRGLAAGITKAQAQYLTLATDRAYDDYSTNNPTE